MKINVQRNIAVIGLGYVGLPVAVAFAKQGYDVIGFDIDMDRVKMLSQGIDKNREVLSVDLLSSHLSFTSDSRLLNRADFHIVAVPTPINQAKQPDLLPLLNASVLLGRQLKVGDIVVYESTVYPGATEEDCVPVLEKESGLKAGVDFCVGYSPERINPGDPDRTFSTICKVVSAQTPEALETIAAVYHEVVTAGIYKAPSIKVAEAAKAIENTQRDVNIALINELAIIFHRLNIDTTEVLKAASTKWNFLPFKPGLVGGHCIGVDPYYLTHKANILGIHSEVILSGRRVNDGMGKYVAEQVIKKMIGLGVKVTHARVGVLGLTFKENCSDIRNTKVIDIINELKAYHVNVLVADALADSVSAKKHYDVDLLDIDALKNLDALIMAVSHAEYLALPVDRLIAMLNIPRLVFDIKSVLDKEKLLEHAIDVWRL